jgi:hypothetical protein
MRSPASFWLWSCPKSLLPLPRLRLDRYCCIPTTYIVHSLGRPLSSVSCIVSSTLCRLILVCCANTVRIYTIFRMSPTDPYSTNQIDPGLLVNIPRYLRPTKRGSRMPPTWPVGTSYSGTNFLAGGQGGYRVHGYMESSVSLSFNVILDPQIVLLLLSLYYF